MLDQILGLSNIKGQKGILNKTPTATTYELAKGVLSIHSNSPNIYGLVFGNLPSCKKMIDSDIAPVSMDYRMVADVRDYYPSFGNADYRDHGLFFMRRPMLNGQETQAILDWNGNERPLLVTNKLYDVWSRLRGTNAHPTVGEIIGNSLAARLPFSGFAGIHCAGFEKNGKATVIVAPSDTGKTTSSFKLVQEKYCNFICEDMAITDGENLYGCPNTSTGYPKGIEEPRVNMLNKMKGKIIYSNYKPSIAHLFEQEQITPSAPLETLVFLKRGEQKVIDLDEETAFEWLYMLNRLEFKFHANRWLLESWNSCGEPNLDKSTQLEKEIIRKLVGKVSRRVLIQAEEPHMFADLIKNI